MRMGLSAEAVDDRVEEFIDDGEDAGRGLESALVLHQIGHFLIHGDAADGVALVADELLDLVLVVRAGRRGGERLAEVTDGAAVELAESAIELVATSDGEGGGRERGDGDSEGVVTRGAVAGEERGSGEAAAQRDGASGGAGRVEKVCARS